MVIFSFVNLFCMGKVLAPLLHYRQLQIYSAAFVKSTRKTDAGDTESSTDPPADPSTGQSVGGWVRPVGLTTDGNYEG